MINILKKMSKNIFIFPIILVMLTLIIGVSFAYYQVSLEGRKEIALNIEGGISLTFNWINEDYTLDSSKVMSDDEGKIQDTYYEFSVSSTVATPKNINYLIYIEEISSTIDNSNVVMYLTDNDDNMLRKPTLVSDLPIYNESNTYKLFVNGFTFVKEGTKTHNYRLRSWLNASSGEYKYKVNVVMTEEDKTPLDQEGIYITNAKYISDIDVDEALCEIENAYSNKFSTNIQLQNSNTSSVTYEVTMYNSTLNDYYFNQVIEKTYTNKDISYKITDLNQYDAIYSKEYKTFTITFYYKNNTSSNNNTLNSELIFDFDMYIDSFKDKVISFADLVTVNKNNKNILLNNPSNYSSITSSYVSFNRDANFNNIEIKNLQGDYSKGLTIILDFYSNAISVGNEGHTHYQQLFSSRTSTGDGISLWYYGEEDKIYFDAGGADGRLNLELQGIGRYLFIYTYADDYDGLIIVNKTKNQVIHTTTKVRNSEKLNDGFKANNYTLYLGGDTNKVHQDKHYQSGSGLRFYNLYINDSGITRTKLISLVKEFGYDLTNDDLSKIQ